ncbi:MAG: hypothetical protein JXR96_16375 [Deltaproteobacteria bacterium]|nr:hypothetical protein [Deltaproteobacteria bacterium]
MRRLSAGPALVPRGLRRGDACDCARARTRRLSASPSLVRLAACAAATLRLRAGEDEAP